MTDQEIIDATIAEEGGFVDNPADPGGATNFGITIPAMTEYIRDVGGDPHLVATRSTIKNLDKGAARDFYAWKMKRSLIDRIPNGDVRAVVFDMATNVGDRQAIKFLQRALGMKTVDGILTPAGPTLCAIPAIDGAKLIRLLCVEQMLFYGRLATGDLTDDDKDGIPDRLEFLGGWLNRLAKKMRAVA